MSLISRLFAPKAERSDYRLLYEGVVRLGRDPSWYRDGEVPDTIDGRFDMISAALALVLLRIEREGAAAAQASALLTELFIQDMEGSVRQIGIGDLMVGKQVGSMMGALGGRISAFRTAIEGETGFEAAVRRNIFHDRDSDAAAIAFVTRGLEQFHAALEKQPVAALLAGEVPGP